MLSNIQKNIIIRAVRIRVENEEDISAVMDSYPKLTEEEREEILKTVSDSFL